MDEKEVLRKVVDTITQSPLRIEIDVVHTNLLDRLLIRLKIRKCKKTFEIKPLVYAQGMRITKELLKVDGNTLGTGNIVTSAFKLLAEKGDLVARCLAIAVGDPRKDPDPALVSFFLNNMTPSEGALIISKLLDKVDVKSFMSTIISATGMSLMKPREIIAPGK